MNSKTAYIILQYLRVSKNGYKTNQVILRGKLICDSEVVALVEKPFYQGMQAQIRDALYAAAKKDKLTVTAEHWWPEIVIDNL